MKDQLLRLTYGVELPPGENLTLPPALVASVAAGRWLVTIEPADRAAVRDYAAFLHSYVPEDEGLYNGCPTR
jgi:hypothetical protein